MSHFSKLLVWLMLLVVSAIALFMTLNWVPDRSVDELKARWAKAPSQFIPINSMQLHLRDEGTKETKAPPIVLLHGTSSSLHTWNGWADELSNEYRVIRFDMPGFGLTGPEPNHDYSVENYVRTVIALLDHLQIDQVIIAGNSLGGHVAWTTALLHPERVTKLVLVDASGLPFKAQSIPLGFKIASIPVLNQLMAQVLPRGMIESSLKNVYGDPDLVTDELVDRYFDMTARAGNRQALSERLNQTQPAYLSKRLAELQLPTLIIWGMQDHLIPPELGEQFNQLIAGSELIRFEKLGHVPQEENPQETVAVLKQFLQQ